MTRFAMRIDPVWRPLLGAFGGMRDASFAEVAEDYVRFRFGLLFDREIPKEEVKSAEKRAMQWWDGYGWRYSPLGRRIGLLGSHSGVVEVQLNKRERWGIFPYQSLAMSLDDPDGFLAALAANGQ
jgi:hypothetical protein